MTRHRQSDSEDPPFNPDELLEFIDLVMSFVKVRGRKRALAAIEALHDGAKSVPQILTEWEQRRTEPGASLPEIFAGLRKEHKGKKFSIEEGIVLGLYDLLGWTNQQMEILLGYPYVRQTLYGIRQKDALQPKKGKQHRKGSDV